MTLTNAFNKAKQIRTSDVYKKWKYNILERDKYKCILCGDNKNIEVDHIKPLSLYPQLALDINNGRVLCRECHKKTDTYGSFSIFKGDQPIHPLLAGDLQYKIEALPCNIEMNGLLIGLRIEFDPNLKKWWCGYRRKRINLVEYGENIQECIDKIFKVLSNSSKINFDLEKRFKINDEKYMSQQSTKILRQELYQYLEILLNRPLSPEEKTKISETFRKGINKFFEEVYLKK